MSRRPILWSLLSCALVFASGAQAQSALQLRAEVELGGTASVPVGYAKGLICDDLSIVGVQLLDGTDNNLLQLTGLKLGTTLCRVGLDPVGPVVLVTIHVLPKKKAAAAPAPIEEAPPPPDADAPASPEAPDEAPAPAAAPTRSPKAEKAAQHATEPAPRDEAETGP